MPRVYSLPYWQVGDVEAACLEKSVLYLFLVTNRTSNLKIELVHVSSISVYSGN